MGQAATLRLLEEAEGHMGGLFELVEGRAADLAAAAGRQAEAQRQLAGELGGLLDSSRSIRSAVDVVIGYQQRSDSVLMRLLGRSYRLEDAAFYAAGLLAAMAAGTSPATARVGRSPRRCVSGCPAWACGLASWLLSLSEASLLTPAAPCAGQSAGDGGDGREPAG